MEENDDVIGLLNKIKDLTFTTESVQYKYWTLSQCLKKCWECKQSKQEDLATYYKRWKTIMEVVESKWGVYTPTNISSSEDADEEKKKFQACVFLNGVNWQVYGKVIDELNNSFIAGQDNYPESVEETVNMLSHRTNIEKTIENNMKKKNRIPSDSDGTIETSFAQSGKKNKQTGRIICYKCGGAGHYANDCPTDSDYESDAESSVESSSALQTRRATPIRDRSGCGWDAQY